MSANINGRADERFDTGFPWRIVARGLLDMVPAGGAWIGQHPGFTDAITDTGPGLMTVYLAAAGAATMYGRCTIATAQGIAHATALAGATLQDLPVLCETDAGGALDGVVFIEVLETAV
jgi:hypothetical protein